MAKIIVHVDLNAFFATCEEIRDPSLANVPVAIGDKGRSGIVSTANYCARKFGVHSGQPTFQALEKCPNLKVIHPDFSYYRVMSHSFFGYLSRFSSLVEKASVDEGFVDMTEYLSSKKDPIEALRLFQLGLQNETGLKCSIGVAPTKWLAKMASDMKKPMGLVLLRRRDIPTLLYPLPVESFWGIGKKTAPALKEAGVQTIGDLYTALQNNESPATKILGKFASTAKEWISGYGEDTVSGETEDAKSISCAETLLHDANSFSEVEETIKQLCHAVSVRALQTGKVGKTVSLGLKDTDFRMHLKSETFDYPIFSEHDLYRIARQLYSNFVGEGESFKFRLVSIALSKLDDRAKQNVQMSFWNYSSFEEQDATKLLIEELNRQMDGPYLTRASQAKGK